MESKMLNYKFSYTDEFSQRTTVEKELEAEATLECVSSYNSIVDVFIGFLSACGYSDKVIEERIKTWK